MFHIHCHKLACYSPNFTMQYPGNWLGVPGNA